jgi:GDP-L-fucose synthase
VIAEDPYADPAELAHEYPGVTLAPMNPKTRSTPSSFAGHNGMVGSAIVRALTARGHDPARILTRSRSEVDLLSASEVRDFFAEEQPGQVYLAAAKVGGIHANNTYPAEFIHDNLAIATNVIHAAHLHDVQKLLFLGSSCIYPRNAPQPMREDALLTGPLEPTNEPYAVAKIAGIKLCESYHRQYGRDYRSVMPTNLYGPNDNYHPENSHVVPALLRRFHEAKQQNAPEVVIWGTGTPKREFLHVDDMAEACVHVMELPEATYRAATQADAQPHQRRHRHCARGLQHPRTRRDHRPRDRLPGPPDLRRHQARRHAPLLDISLIRSLGWQPRMVRSEEGLRQGVRRLPMVGKPHSSPASPARTAPTSPNSCSPRATPSTASSAAAACSTPIASTTCTRTRTIRIAASSCTTAT